MYTKELRELKAAILDLTDEYGKEGNNQKENIWNAFDKLESKLTNQPQQTVSDGDVRSVFDEWNRKFNPFYPKSRNLTDQHVVGFGKYLRDKL